MKQHTTPDQTAKLIELGFEKPKGWCVEGISSRLIMYKHKEDDEDFNYSIGELIEMLPKHIHLDGLCLDLCIHANQHLWIVEYSGLFCEKIYRFCSKELADALYDMILKLKENVGI